MMRSFSARTVPAPKLNAMVNEAIKMYFIAAPSRIPSRILPNPRRTGSLDAQLKRRRPFTLDGIGAAGGPNLGGKA
jgi:hypothetical protein